MVARALRAPQAQRLIRAQPVAQAPPALLGLLLRVPPVLEKRAQPAIEDPRATLVLVVAKV